MCVYESAHQWSMGKLLALDKAGMRGVSGLGFGLLNCYLFLIGCDKESLCGQTLARLL